MTYQATLCEIDAERAIVKLESKRKDQKSQLKKAFIDFICNVVGKPDYSFTLTLNPVNGPRRTSTKINDAEQAMDWFLHVLNTKCFGHGYRRNGIELGVFAALEGLKIGQQPHWHGAFRLPNDFSRDKFLLAFEYAKSRTKRFGWQEHLEPYYEGTWHKYITKTGVSSIAPQFLRRGAP